LDTELIRRAQAGEREAFARLVADHYDFVHAAAWRWTRKRSEAEDIAQDVFVRLAGAIRSYRGEGRFRTWLYALTLNAVRDQARKESREQRRMEEWRLDPTNGSADDRDDQTQALWTAVQMLPPRQRDAVMLVYSEGLDHGEAAEVLGCSEGTVSWHLHAARKRLKDILGREVA
jgi:RNA polymerase sigma-70 factor (ECF subfamily)